MSPTLRLDNIFGVKLRVEKVLDVFLHEFIVFFHKSSSVIIIDMIVMPFCMFCYCKTLVLKANRGVKMVNFHVTPKCFSETAVSTTI